MGTLFAVNPRRRRRSKSRKQRSAAQRAATARLVALNKGKYRRNPRRRAKASRRKQRGFVAVPHVSRGLRRRARRMLGGAVASYRGGLIGGAVGLLKAGAVGGAGAVVVDIGMSYVRSVLPASMASPVNADGTANFGYFGAKAALAVALGTYGKRIIPGGYAGRMAEGALTVMAYQLMRPMVPASMLGVYSNPGATQRPSGMNGVRGVRGTAAYTSLPSAVRSGPTGSGRGARASLALAAVGGR